MARINVLGMELFTGPRWFDVMEGRMRRLQNEINGADVADISGKSTDELCDEYVEKLGIKVPVLRLKDKTTSTHQGVLIEDKEDPWGRAAHRRGPLMLTGTRVEAKIPFFGKADAFNIQPTKRSTHIPRGEIEGGILVVRCDGIGEDAAKVEEEVDREIGCFEEHLGYLRADADKLEEQIRQSAKELIERRRRPAG